MGGKYLGRKVSVASTSLTSGGPTVLVRPSLPPSAGVSRPSRPHPRQPNLLTEGRGFPQRGLVLPMVCVPSDRRRRLVFGIRPKSETARYASTVSLVEVVNDLLDLQDLAQYEEDPERRRLLDEVREHVARRGGGAKVSEAADVLGISQPTVRSWIEAGVLPAVAATKPVRIDVLALAETKRALDLIREHADDRQLLVHVMRVLRDRAALEGSEEGFADLQAGCTVPVGDDLRAEIAQLRTRKSRRRSKSG